MHEQSLFDQSSASDEAIRIAIPDAELTFFEHAFSGAEANAHFDALLDSTPWRSDEIRIHGKIIPIPRLQAWYCDDDRPLNYSGMQVPALPLTNRLRLIRQRVVELTGSTFNGVLVNCYRDGNDSVGWHSDNEPEWGPNPVIASVSFGAARDFVLKHSRDKTLKPVSHLLTHGSLLVMGGTVQSTWQHQLPKRKRVIETRINLTFRNLVQPGR